MYFLDIHLRVLARPSAGPMWCLCDSIISEQVARAGRHKKARTVPGYVLCAVVYALVILSTFRAFHPAGSDP